MKLTESCTLGANLPSSSLLVIRQPKSNFMEVLSCLYCPRQFETRSALNVHTDSRHSLSCPHCTTILFTSDALQHHLIHYHPFACDDCRIDFRDEIELSQHDDEEHTILFDCNHCRRSGHSRQFESQAALDQHQQSAAGHTTYCAPHDRHFMSWNNLAEVCSIVACTLTFC